MGNDTDAIRDFTISMQSHKIQRARDYNGRYELKLLLGGTVGAILDINQAIVLFFLDAYSRSIRTRFLHDQGKFTQALIDYRVAIRMNPKDEVTLNDIDLCYYYVSKLESACIMWRKAGELGSKDAFDNINKYCK